MLSDAEATRRSYGPRRGTPAPARPPGPLPRRVAREEPVEQKDHCQHVDRAADRPHDDATKRLALQRAQPPRRARRPIGGVERDGARREQESEGRALERAVDEVDDAERRMHGTAEMGLRADDGPPEQDRAAEEREVLEVMEAAITERRLVGPRKMPTPEAEGVREPRYGSTRQGLPDPAHGRATHEEPPGPNASPRRQGPEER